MACAPTGSWAYAIRPYGGHLFFLLLLFLVFSVGAHAESSFSAAIEIGESDMIVTFPPDMTARIVEEKWDVLAFIYKPFDRPVLKTAYVLSPVGDGSYRLKAAYPKKADWTLDLVLAPPKGDDIIGTFKFSDRILVR